MIPGTGDPPQPPLSSADARSGATSMTLLGAAHSPIFYVCLTLGLPLTPPISEGCGSELNKSTVNDSGGPREAEPQRNTGHEPTLRC